ncbi:hypothetical protein AS850_01150 [Frondihabitans sp. 762G35]|uniref:hypothetical protein n=1 Tax=Frondihabitans sp. 762G35 TaxID=1446794 RepID=UPI000D20B02F|nr:hypothetical protein [Frondihabitans sp. 762G35]ARC55681.1 hypothetical protein AS850_01150 [Frondihabitans sp. 762G35]
MHVQLKLTLACSPDAAVDALRNPQVMVAVTKPMLVYRSEEQGGFPRRWDTAEHPVSARILGVFSLGRTHVHLRFYEALGARVQEDTGRGIDGSFRLMRIRHRMAVSPAPGGLTLLRDRMEFHAGVLTPLLWPGLWLVWQWRAARMRMLAPTWTTPVPR